MKAYSAKDLKNFCIDVLKAVGMGEGDASIVSDSLIKANLDGVDSHGISRLPIYVKRFCDHRINIHPHLKTEEKTPSVLLVDGDNGLGHIVCYHAIKKAVKMAKASGITAIAIKNSNHFGTVSYFCELACDHHLACIGFTNSPPGIAPWGGKEAFFGTNPVAFGFPTGNDQPVIIDLSTSITARGKIIAAAKQGSKIPDGWAMDEDGNPTNDPNAALKGAVLPMGGAKGAALALAVEILSGVLTGAAFGPHVKSIYDEHESGYANVGHFFILMDIEKFMSLKQFLTMMQRLLEEMKAVPKSTASQEIRYPGERKFKERKHRLAAGIPLPANVEEELIAVARQFQVHFPQPIDQGAE
ncbi:Ldh family oxidoreductase [Heyndrickxia acidiproducens]|uniref:Ldh family oxidoreductase n=1 Tax=Heyndrickxia acidiproducens TaxID=1121084 RepID=UPI00036B2E73|nr:Ldh family oxidoreductase [Heyndrickxia acidiproducens]